MYMAETLEDFLSPEQMLTMSGLEFVRGMLSGKIAGPPIANTLNFHLHSVEEGSVTFLGTTGFTHMNPMRSVHGGWYGAILDSCMGCAVMSIVPKGRYYTTLEFKINITKAIPVGMTVQAIGTVQHAGRSTSVANGEIRGVDDGKLYATGSTTCIIMKPV
ncbi:MAG: PaaI family thioesterase [Paracoccaceae bacterium]